MRKVPSVAIVGAGSLSHGKRLIDDLLTVRELEGGRLSLMGTNVQRLKTVGDYARRAAADLMPSLEIRVGTDRESAIEDADLVLALFDAGGFSAFDLDYRIARRFGLDFCVGDTVGPLGIMRGLRNGALMLSLAEDIRRLCPEALLVNYSNPMAPLVAAAASRGVAAIGVCGGLEATRSYVAGVLGVDARELHTTFAGVNHLAWLLEASGPGGDLYPRFRELMGDPDRRGYEAVRFEILQQFGYFATESSGHLSDFFPWFRRSPEMRRRYCAAPGFAGASGAYYKLCDFAQRRIGQVDYLEGAVPSRRRSSDYGPAAVEARLGGRPVRIHANAMNHGPDGRILLDGIPGSACVELPVALEGREISFPAAPRLPPALAALCAPSAIQHGLILEALIAEDGELAFAAMASDQLTSACLDLPEIRRLAEELLSANAPWLPTGLRGPLRATADAAARPSAAFTAVAKDDSLFEIVKAYERRRRAKGGS
jgi:alpha-galactosidase